MPGSNPLLSVACLGYKHAPFIKDCITSIWNDPWPNKEIIAMDDGSGDGSVEILKELQAASPCPFKILEQENSGNIPANFNKLYKASCGDFIMFTALDDMQLPNAIQARMGRLLADGNSVFAAHTRGYALEGRELAEETTPIDKLAAACGPGLAAKALEMERTNLHTFYIQGAIFRRSIVAKVNGFSENMLGDDIVLRTKVFFHMLAHPELSFYLIREPGFIYRRHCGNVSQNLTRQIKLAFQYYQKFWKGKPYPPRMKGWILAGLNEEPWEKITGLFATSPEAASFLSDPAIQEGLRLNAVRSYIKENQ